MPVGFDLRLLTQAADFDFFETPVTAETVGRDQVVSVSLLAAAAAALLGTVAVVQ